MDFLQNQKGLENKTSFKRSDLYINETKKVMKKLKIIFRFLELLCEGHHNNLQKLLLNQKNNPNS